MFKPFLLFNLKQITKIYFQGKYITVKKYIWVIKYTCIMFEY